MFKFVVYPIVFHIVFSACMYFGFVQDIVGFQYIAKFWIWAIMFPVSILLLIGISSPKYVKMETSKQPRFMKNIIFVMNLAYLLTFVFYGHIVTAIAVMFSMILLGLAWLVSYQIREPLTLLF